MQQSSQNQESNKAQVRQIHEQEVKLQHRLPKQKQEQSVSAKTATEK
jgi:hypothetical protein